MCWERHRTFAGNQHAVGDARHFVHDALYFLLGLHAVSRIDDVTLVASELMTAAVATDARHLELTLAVHRDWARVTVRDDGQTQLRARHPCSTGDLGLGLAVIAALSREWALEPAEAGKQAWAEVTIDTPDRIPCHLVPAPA